MKALDEYRIWIITEDSFQLYYKPLDKETQQRRVSTRQISICIQQGN